jgi:hypothetical protein
VDTGHQWEAAPADGFRRITGDDLADALDLPHAPTLHNPPSMSRPLPLARASGSRSKPLLPCGCDGSGQTTMDAAEAVRRQLVVAAVYPQGARQVALVLCPGCAAGQALARVWSGLPDEATGVRLDNNRLVLLEDPSYDQALAAVQDLIRTPRGWLTLAGGYGTGKTTLIYAALNHLADRGVYGRYTTAPALLDYLRDGLAPGVETPGSRLRGLAEVPILAVDELDKYSATAFAEEQIFKLFHARYQQRRTHATLIGYNLDGAERIPPFLASRIRDGRFQYIELRGADVRPALGALDPWDRGRDDYP